MQIILAVRKESLLSFAPQSENGAIAMSNDYYARAMMLFLRLNQQSMQYTPLSHKGQRARRIMQRLAVRMALAS